jgi:molybdate transport repressor ModE-like protein
MKMSYRKAWTTLKAIKTKLGFPLLEWKVGDIAGGGSHLTEQCRNLLKHYVKFRSEVKISLESLYQKHFSYKTNTQLYSRCTYGMMQK